MPMCFVEAPKGLPLEAKRRLHEHLSKAICGAYGIADVRTYIREYSLENAAQDGQVEGEPVRAICVLEVSELRSWIYEDGLFPKSTPRWSRRTDKSRVSTRKWSSSTNMRRKTLAG